MKKSESQDRIRVVLAGVLAPLARTLLRCGIGFTEFSEIAKRAFVHAASTDYGVRNRPTSIARVAVMTGLSRREVSKVRRELARHGLVQAPTRNIPAEILERWHTDPAFLDEHNQPRPLTYSSGRVSFVALVKSVTSDLPPKALERELVRAGALRIGVGRKIVPVGREFVPLGTREKLLDGLQYGLRRLAETISFNADPDNQGNSRFQRVVHVSRVPPTLVPELRESLAGILTNFATRVDDHIGSFQERDRVKKGSRQATVGIGLYYFEGETEQ